MTPSAWGETEGRSPARLFVLVSTALLVALAFGLLFRSPRQRSRNVLLLMIDTLRADHLGCYGYALPTSPFIDELAAESVLFESAIGTASQTVPAVLSIWTQLYPSRHGNQFFHATNSFRRRAKRVARGSEVCAARYVEADPPARPAGGRGLRPDRRPPRANVPSNSSSTGASISIAPSPNSWRASRRPR